MAYSEEEVRVRIQAPLEHQAAPLDDETRFKLWPWGRRAGKTRAGFIAGCVGHGPGIGFLQGGEILWVARDYTQAQTVWYQEIMPRFAGKPGFSVNQQKNWVKLDSGGTFRVVSAENIDSLRGGDWDGVIIDEAAHIDLKYIIFDVVRPGLADRRGWLIVMSTTKGGSYFNDLCLDVRDGHREGWALSQLTAFDNPKIDDDEMHALIAEYGTNEVKLQQEIYASLTLPGGHAFPEWDERAHVGVLSDLPDSWPGVGMMDWGFVHSGYFGYARIGEQGEVYVAWELPFKGREPKEVGAAVGVMLKTYDAIPPGDPKREHHPLPLYIVADSQMFVRDQSAVTIADQVQRGMAQVLGSRAPSLIPAIKGPESRITGKVLVHQHLRFATENADGVPSPWEAPLLRYHPRCEYSIKHFPRLPRSQKNPEDVDTKSEDHFYDSLRYLLLMHKPQVEDRHDPFEDFNYDDLDDPAAAQALLGRIAVSQHRHPGFSKNGKRKERRKSIRNYMQEMGLADSAPASDGSYMEPNEFWRDHFEWEDEHA